MTRTRYTLTSLAMRTRIFLMQQKTFTSHNVTHADSLSALTAADKTWCLRSRAVKDYIMLQVAGTIFFSNLLHSNRHRKSISGNKLMGRL